ncbi:hypothetical protein, partial [Lactobacillus delbrueckii]|uniref:hypothetical protein n=1 Tax=Lactobacillus delbrueckii TaxID=1584 RepID=UPI003A892A2B
VLLDRLFCLREEEGESGSMFKLKLKQQLSIVNAFHLQLKQKLRILPMRIQKTLLPSGKRVIF